MLKLGLNLFTNDNESVINTSPLTFADGMNYARVCNEFTQCCNAFENLITINKLLHEKNDAQTHAALEALVDSEIIQYAASTEGLKEAWDWIVDKWHKFCEWVRRVWKVLTFQKTDTETYLFSEVHRQTSKILELDSKLIDEQYNHYLTKSNLDRATTKLTEATDENKKLLDIIGRLKGDINASNIEIQKLTKLTKKSHDNDVLAILGKRNIEIAEYFDMFEELGEGDDGDIELGHVIFLGACMGKVPNAVVIDSFINKFGDLAEDMAAHSKTDKEFYEFIKQSKSDQEDSALLKLMMETSRDTSLSVKERFAALLLFSYRDYNAGNVNRSQLIDRMKKTVQTTKLSFKQLCALGETFGNTKTIGDHGKAVIDRVIEEGDKRVAALSSDTTSEEYKLAKDVLICYQNCNKIIIELQRGVRDAGRFAAKVLGSSGYAVCVKAERAQDNT